MKIQDNEVDSDVHSNSLNNTLNALEEWIPKYEDELKLKVGMVFDTTGDGGEFYKRYAYAVGFSVSNSTKTKDKQSVRWKYILCLKEGFKVKKKVVQTELIVDKKKFVQR
ncbi:hypothetical protein AHAS_Ahas13G0208400 [Arachis hypogaea]